MQNSLTRTFSRHSWLPCRPIAFRSSTQSSVPSISTVSRLSFRAQLSTTKCAQQEPEVGGEYEPAKTWEGLEWVGTPEWKVERRALQREKTTEVFPSTPLVLNAAEIYQILHSIVLEVCLLKEADRLETIVSLPFPRYSLHLVQSSGLKVKDEKEWTVEFAEPNTKQRLLSQILDGQTEEQETQSSVESGTDAIPDKAADENDLFWREMSLADAKIKLAITRRFLKLTGHRISDFDLMKPTVGELADRLVQQIYRSKKVAQLLIEDERVSSLPNVTIHAKPLTLADKEKEVGRWKVIEGELRRKNLPLTTTV